MMHSSSHPFDPIIPKLALNFKWHEGLALVATFAVSLGMIIGGSGFAKAGLSISLPTSFGSLGQQGPKIFSFELYIVLLFSLCLIRWRSTYRQLFKIWADPMGKVLFGLIFLGMARASVDLTANPLLGIRNSAFVWYLTVPLLLALLKLPASGIETLTKVVTATVFLTFIGSLGSTLFYRKILLDWQPSTGLCFVFAFALLTLHRRVGILSLICLGLPLGFNLWGKFQRTSLVALGVTLILVIRSFPDLRKAISRRIAIFLLAFSVGAAIWVPYSSSSFGNFSPFSKAQSNELGIEIFRSSMWKDALELFFEKPLIGIGFQRQVVTRVFYGGNKYVENNGNFEHAGSPPISGPHNSYLNALARLGVLGVLFLIVHIVAARRLWVAGLYATFFLLLGQMVYAFFNVGLEGPLRSSLLLVALGSALLIKQEVSDSPSPSNRSL